MKPVLHTFGRLIFVLATGVTVLPAALLVIAEPPATQNSSVCPACAYTFDSLATGNYTSLGSATSPLTLAPGITGYFDLLNPTGTSRIRILAADQYGGADGTGNYLAGPTGNDRTVPIVLHLTTPADYLGLWLSAIDNYNVIQFWSEGTEVGTFVTVTGTGIPGAEVLPEATGGCPASAYCGNPNPPGGNTSQRYVYYNFDGSADGTTFDEVRFYQRTNNAGLELDNIALGLFGDYETVPEPWTFALTGGGLLGLGLVRRRALSALRRH
jgi:hypothetical protein